MNRRFITLSMTLLIAACSGGGGGSGGGSSATNQASGPLSVPNATCGGNSCISKSSTMVTPAAVASNVAVLQVAGEIYANFTEKIIPGINGILYKMEQAAAENNLKTCDDIAGASDAMGYPLGSGYTVDISNGDKSIPVPMANSTTTMAKKFIFSYNSAKFAEAQIYCNSATQRTFYVRLMDTSANMYEFWSQVEGNKRTLFGAMDRGAEKYTLFFKTVDGTNFELHTVGNQVDYNGTTVSFAVAGGANLTTDVADIAYASGTTIPTDKTAEAANLSWLYTDIRHCYSAMSTATVTGSCSGLLAPAPTSIPVRASATNWSVSGMMSASILATF